MLEAAVAIVTVSLGDVWIVTCGDEEPVFEKLLNAATASLMHTIAVLITSEALTGSPDTTAATISMLTSPKHWAV
jgi:hypothetical protein